MKKLFSVVMLMLSLFSIFVAPPVVMAGPSDTYVLYPISADPCQNPSVAKSSAVISAATATTTQLVALTAAKSIYVCSLDAFIPGTTTLTTFQLISGTTTTTPCDTGAANVSGIQGVTSAVGTNIHMGFGGTLFKVASAKALCSTQTGTSSAWSGTITYVKQ